MRGHKFLGQQFGLTHVSRAAAALGRIAACWALALFLSVSAAFAQASRWEGRPIADISIVYEGADTDISSAEQFRLIARDALGDTYSTVRVRDAIAEIYETGRVATVTVEALDAPGNTVNLRFVLRRQTLARRVAIEIVEGEDVDVSEEDLLLRVNLLDPGTVVNERVLQTNADLILEYLRERGYYRAEARYEQRPMATGNDVAVVFRVTTGTQATVESFNIDIQGFDNAALLSDVRLQPGSPFSREELERDIERIRETLRESDFLAPTISEPRIIYDSSTNTISISLTGSAGPTIEVVVDAEESRVGNSTQNRLLPIKRDGTLDYAAIIEGERRLENHYQERGYFFVDVVAVCSVEPPVTERDSTLLPNGTEYLCSVLTSSDLAGRNVEVRYVVDLDRRLRLEEMRLEGTDQFTIDEIKPVLDTQEANILGIIPIFGYGRGYTSQRILENDAATIRSLLRELGYRDAEVRVNQGVSLTGDELIITFVVDQGEPTVVSGVRIDGNTAFTDAELEGVLPDLVGRNFSRARVRNGQREISEYYAERGYFDANISFSIEEESLDPATGNPRFEVVYNIENEGVPVYINRILITGNVRTKTQAIEKALTIESDTLLRATDIYTSEQNLYASDAFERVNITTQPVGDRAGGGRLTDVIVEVVEQAPRLLQYGGGFSTDLGPNAFVDIRHFNLLGNLWQGGARVRMSRRQQLVQLDFVNPRFINDRGDNRYAPLTVSAQYQRDSTVTRFFRSAFDQGTFGIVQRVDEEGNPIDEFGAPAGDPTLNRLTLTAESNRTLSRRDRSIVFFRYRFEDVRLTNIRSLLIRDLLEPDSRIRISGFGTTFVRDTRRRCGIEYTILEIIARGEPGEPCRYNVSDPTHGDYFTAEYNVSLPVLGANIGFHKFQASYNVYYTLKGFRNTTLAARGILGLASVFSKRERFASEQFPDLEGILPISERFFAGGSNTLRGFDFESAGPRVVIVPQGEFRNRDGEPVFLDPFTVPFGGNALAVVNLEARVPVNDWLRVVPFYDGGNVFRRVGDILNPPDVPEDDVFRRNLRALWTHTVGLGFRFKTPIGGEFGIDYGYLLNPPTFIIPQGNNPPAFYRLPQGQLHFRFSQAF